MFHPEQQLWRSAVPSNGSEKYEKKTFIHVAYLKCFALVPELHSIQSGMVAKEPIWNEQCIVYSFVCSTMCEPVKLSIDCHRTCGSQRKSFYDGMDQTRSVRAKGENLEEFSTLWWVQFIQLLTTRRTQSEFIVQFLLQSCYPFEIRLKRCFKSSFMLPCCFHSTDECCFHSIVAKSEFPSHHSLSQYSICDSVNHLYVA